jgi:hypothetical protein
MIALQSRNAPLPDPSRQTAQFANMINMARQTEAAQRQAALAQQQMQYAKTAEERAVAGEARDVEKFGVEQPARVAGALGAGLVGILHNPSNENIMQAGQTFASVGMEQDKFGPILKQIQDIPDPNARKLFVMQFISQSEPARAALKFVMPEVKSEKVGDATVFYDANPASPIMGQELFRFTVAPEPVKLTQNVVDKTLFNTNPVTGVSAEALIGDPTQGANLPAREPTFASTGVRSPYAVGAGTGQPSMATPAAPPAQAVGVPTGGSRGAPGQGNTADVVYGFGEYGSPDKPLSTMRMGDVQKFQLKLIDKTRGDVGQGPRIGTGAVGTYQFTHGTLKEMAPKVFGANWRDVPFTADNQEKLAKALYEERKGGDIKKTWAGLPSNRPGQYTNVPWEQVRNQIIQVESAGGGNRRTPTGTPTGGAPQTVSQALTEKEKARTFNKFVDVTGFDFKTGKDPVADLIKQSTGGGGEKLGADIMAFIPESMGGGGTKGMDAISALNVITSDLILTLAPEGKLSAGVSNEDRKLYERLVGDINNPALTRSARLSAWNQIKTRMARLGGATMPKAATPTGGSKGKDKTDKIPTLTAAQVRANPNIKRWRRADNGEIMVRR